MQDGKTSRLTYVEASVKEEESIRVGLSTYLVDDAVNQLLKGQHLVIGKGRRNEVFLVSEPLWELFHQVQPQHPYFIGVFLGELKESEFNPSLHVLHTLVDIAEPSAKVVTDASGEQRFLYGHTLQFHEFQSQGSESEAARVLVVSNEGDGLGYGRLVKTPSGEELKNQLDLGWYLRRGR